MLEGIIPLASYGYYGGAIGSILSQWEQMGMFSYLLPFLLIFALVFGLLAKINIFGTKEKPNRTIDAVISLAVSLMSLQFDFVPRFFSEVFPRLGVGLAVLLIAIILLGLFATQKTWMTYTFFGIAAVIFITVLVQSSGAIGWSTSGWLGRVYWPDWIPLIVIIVLIAVVIGASIPKKEKSQDTSSGFMRVLDQIGKGGKE